MIIDDRRVITIYKNEKNRKKMHKVEESQLDGKYICGPKTNSLWFKIKTEYDSHYEVYVSEL